MRWLSRHQTIILVVVLVGVVWGALWLVYDFRSPVSQWFRAYGSAQIDGWSYNDLDAMCIRLEPSDGTPVATVENAGRLALKAYSGGYVREILLVSFVDTCSGAKPRLAWAVTVAWPVALDAAPGAGAVPRAIVLVDAKTGDFIVGRSVGQPRSSPTP